jgi:hypothetical protein
VTATRPRQSHRAGLVDWLCVAVVVVVLSGFAFLLVISDYVADGPVLISVSGTHGLHEGDVFIGVGWVAAVASLLLLTVRRRRG